MMANYTPANYSLNSEEISVGSICIAITAHLKWQMERSTFD